MLLLLGLVGVRSPVVLFILGEVLEGEDDEGADEEVTGVFLLSIHFLFVLTCFAIDFFETTDPQ